MKSGQKLQWLAMVRRILPGDTTAHSVAGALIDRLNTRTGKCNPSVSMLGRDCGLHTTTIRNALQRLRSAGLLSYSPRFSGGVQSSNNYKPQTPSASASTPPSAGASTPPSANRPEVLAQTVDRILKDESKTPRAVDGGGFENSTDTDCCGSALGGRPPQSAPDGGNEGQNRVDIAAEREKLRRLLNATTPGASPAGLQ